MSRARTPLARIQAGKMLVFEGIEAAFICS